MLEKSNNTTEKIAAANTTKIGQSDMKIELTDVKSKKCAKPNSNDSGQRSEPLDLESVKLRNKKRQEAGKNEEQGSKEVK